MVEVVVVSVEESVNVVDDSVVASVARSVKGETVDNADMVVTMVDGTWLLG